MIKDQLEVYCKVMFNLTSDILGTDQFYIAGGAIRDFVENPDEAHKKVKDIDCFFSCSSAWHDACDRLIRDEWFIDKARDHSKVFSKPGKASLDLVLTEERSPQDIIKNFDLTCCCAAYGKNGLYMAPDFIKDTQNRVLRINMVKLPYHTIQRIDKFKERGYTISDEEAARVLAYAAKAPWGPEKETEYNGL